jgi:hypothetical protein
MDHGVFTRIGRLETTGPVDLDQMLAAGDAKLTWVNNRRAVRVMLNP